jgi:hypothetical protein
MLGCGLDLVSPSSCRRTSVSYTLPIPALSDSITSTSDYLVHSLERNITALACLHILFLHELVALIFIQEECFKGVSSNLGLCEEQSAAESQNGAPVRARYG